MPGVGGLVEDYVTSETLDAELEKWMAEIAPYRWRELEPFDASQAALLVVDMSRPFVEAGFPLSSPAARAVLPRIAELADAFRKAGRPVLWIVQAHHTVEADRGPLLSRWWPKPLLEGTADVEMAAGLKPLPEEKIIHKRRYSGFYQTDLELTLRCLGVRQVVVCGVLTHVCPLTTAFDAFQRDLCVFYPADGTASLNKDLHLGALRSIAGWCGHVVRAREIRAWLESRRGG